MTPTTQSVVVPVEPMPEMIAAWYRVKNGHHFHDEPVPTDTSDYAAYRAMLAAAPAPSSLAGGETMREAVARIIDPDAFGLPVSGRAPLDEPVSDKQANQYNRDGALIKADAILAALSPEAPAREGEMRVVPRKPTDRDVSEILYNINRKRRDADELTEADVREVMDNYFYNVGQPGPDAAALTPRLEAPAEGAGEPWGWDREVCTGCSASLTFADIKARGCVSCCPDRRMVKVRDLVDAYEAPLRARSSAPEARSTVSVLAEALHDRMFGVSSLKDPTLALDEISDGGGLHEAAHELLRALPPRGPAPEAREGEVVGTMTPEAVENLKAGGSSAIRPPHHADVALYTRPAAPSADKLRTAVEALEPFDAHFRRFDYAPVQDFEVAEVSVGELRAASKALAALKAEG